MLASLELEGLGLAVVAALVVEVAIGVLAAFEDEFVGDVHAELSLSGCGCGG